MRSLKSMRLPLAGVALAALCVASPGQTTVAVVAGPNAAAMTDSGQSEKALAGHNRAVAPIKASASPFEDSAGASGDRHRMESLRATVRFATPVPKGTIIVDTEGGVLYRAAGDGTASRYGIGIGPSGFTWSGVERVSEMTVWPDWSPAAELRERHPSLPEVVPGGPDNPLGARALRLGSTIHRIHGTSAQQSGDGPAPLGSIRMLNSDITELFEEVRLGTEVIVLGPGSDRTGLLAAVSAL